MLDYSCVINNPFPDVRDPVTGEWLPPSASQIKAERNQRLSEQSQRNMLNTLLSLTK